MTHRPTATAEQAHSRPIEPLGDLAGRAASHAIGIERSRGNWLCCSSACRSPRLEQGILRRPYTTEDRDRSPSGIGDLLLVDYSDARAIVTLRNRVADWTTTPAHVTGSRVPPRYLQVEPGHSSANAATGRPGSRAAVQEPTGALRTWRQGWRPWPPRRDHAECLAYVTTDGGLIAPPTDDIVRPARLLRAELAAVGRPPS